MAMSTSRDGAPRAALGSYARASLPSRKRTSRNPQEVWALKNEAEKHLGTAHKSQREPMSIAKVHATYYLKHSYKAFGGSRMETINQKIRKAFAEEHQSEKISFFLRTVNCNIVIL